MGEDSDGEDSDGEDSDGGDSDGEDSDGEARTERTEKAMPHSGAATAQIADWTEGNSDRR